MPVSFASSTINFLNTKEENFSLKKNLEGFENLLGFVGITKDSSARHRIVLSPPPVQIVPEAAPPKPPSD